MKVSIFCLTYNHGRFLEEAIKSFLQQETAFEVEIVISDDASTDGTPELVNEYCKKYSNVKYHRHASNIGMMPNVVYTFKQCTGDYIALCEGDDYWIDPLKLQKQVDFLEANKEYSICFTGSITRNEFTGKEEIQIPPGDVTVEELIKQNRFDTATAVFDAQYMRPVPGWFKELPFGDWATYLTVMYRSKKKAGCIPEAMAVRRLHGGGAYTSMHQSDEKILKALKWDIDFYNKMQTHLFKGAYNALIESCIKDKEEVLSYLSDNSGSNTSVLNDIVSHVPANGSFILVDEWYLNAAGLVEGKKVLPFLEQDGVYWGRPADDEAAIAEIERQQRNGVNVMVFTWQAFWWLEHYSGMYTYLKENYRCILNNGCLIGFDLQKRNLKQSGVEMQNESSLHPTST